MTSAVIFDLDGTLCDIGHRLHHVRDGGHNWDEFFAGIPDDTAHLPILNTLLAFYCRGYTIILCSGRPERCRHDTVQWLARYGVPYAELYMRPDNDTRPDHIIKSQILDGIYADGYDVMLVVDDRQSVVEMWRERGLTCLQCAPSDREIPESAVLTLMVGPSCAGKSTWLRGQTAYHDFGIRQHHIISSDLMRQDLCGDFRIQTKNEEVFAAVHAVAKARLHHGLPTVIDATHIRRRDRVGAAALAEGKCPVRYIVIDRPIEGKRRDGDWRNFVVTKDNDPFDLIGKHHATFYSQRKEILAGDDLPNVQVYDFTGQLYRSAA